MFPLAQLCPSDRILRALRCSAGLALATGLTACGSAAAPAGAPAEPGRSASSATLACTTPHLRVTLDAGAAGAAAGSSYVPLVFDNASSASCTLGGYPAVTFAAGLAGPQIGTAAALARGIRAATLVLAPGSVAHAWLQILDVASYPASKCKSVQANGLRVALAGTPTAAFLAHPFQTCANGVAGSTVLAVFPVQAGPARRGTAP
jgi:Protein of unknown function (DUF4232)